MGLFGGGGNKHQKRGQPGNPGQFAPENRGATAPNTGGPSTHTSNTQTTTPNPTVAVDGMYDSFKIKTGARTAPQHAKPQAAQWYTSMPRGYGKSIAKAIMGIGAAGLAGLTGLAVGGPFAGVILLGSLVAMGYFAYRAMKPFRQGGRNAQMINQQAEFAERHNIDQNPHEAFESAHKARQKMNRPRPKMEEILKRRNEHIVAQLRTLRDAPNGKKIAVDSHYKDGVFHMRFKESETNYPLGSSAWDPKERIVSAER